MLTFKAFRLAATASTVGLVPLLPAPMAALAAPPPANSVGVDRSGWVDAEGAVTLSGSYRCSAPAKPGSVFVGSNIRQGLQSSGVGGSTAVCDGKAHRWRNTGHANQTPRGPGGVQADASLLWLERNRQGIPVPHVLATTERDITLVARP
ncbi:DUF6299 family protein [Streptomyces olivoverticillatus]